MQTSLRPWLMWNLPLSFFGFQFILRLFPGLVMPEMLAKYQINATQFGFFASMYYFGYASMQIPIAILLDKFGPRLIITFSILTCSLATFLSVYTNHWYLILISRILIGAASAVGFLGTSKVIALWFPKAQYARMVGLTFTFGLMGAIYGGKPVSHLINQFGWETVLLYIGVLSGALAIGTLLLVRNSHQFKPNHTTSICTALKTIFCHKRILFIGIANLLMVGSLEGFADIWGVTYLMQSRDITKETATMITSSIFVGMIFGGPILAYLAEKLKAHYQVTAFCGLFMGFIFITVLLLNPHIPHIVLCSLMFLVGILCCYQVLVFTIGAELVSPEIMSIVVAFLNCINMLGGFFFHFSIGHLMDFFWAGQLDAGLKVYTTETYSQALAIIPIASILGSYIFLKFSPKLSKQSMQLQTNPI